jgi:hypothetical protein
VPGSRLALISNTSEPQLGADARFARLRGIAETTRRLGPFTLRLGGHVGYMRTPDGLGEPLSDRLAGGTLADVRRGPSAKGQSSAEAMGHLELELPLWAKAGLSVATFVHAGVRQNFDPSTGATDLTRVGAAGASLIWRRRSAWLRLDVATPLGDRGGGLLMLLSAGFAL